MASLLRSKRILISVGSGGVGKTTVAAALGLLAARLGDRRTLVMTIDPARRLATSLGLTELGHEVQEVAPDKLAQRGVPRELLYAMMLDPQQSFDEMVRRYAPDSATVQRLLAGKLYRQISSKLAGAQEYAAMEKLHAVDRSGAYGLLVLDTPPTANALDFLDAPQKMIDAVASPAVNLFVKAYNGAGGLNLGLLGFGAAYVVRRLARFTGGEFLDDIAGFLVDLSGLLGGMRQRAEQVIQLLHSDEVGFVIVTSPDPRAIDEAIAFHDRLVASGMHPQAYVINRVRPLRETTLERKALAQRLGPLLGRSAVQSEDGDAAVGDSVAGDLAQHLLTAHQQMRALAQADARQVARLRQHCGEGQLYVQVPLFDEDVHDVDGLLRLGQHLEQPRAGEA